MTETPLDRADLRARVEKALAGFLARQRAALADVGPELVPVGEAVERLVLDGGKRLRPAFCYWGWRGAGGPDADEPVTAAAALELLHAAALVHDDVIDRSDSRRGQPAVHRRFAMLHRESEWLGDPERFGQSAAILVGDLCLVWADAMLWGAGLPPEALARAQVVYDAMRAELMAGQYLDVVEQALGGGSAARALRVARYKTARYTIEGPLHLGGSLAGGGRDVLDAYSAYGLPLGEAFQLRDDVLGVFGDPVSTGKPAGDDLREGKRTALVALAVERADAAQAAVIRHHLGDPDLDDAGVAALQEVIVATGALSEVEDLVTRRTADAVDALAGSPVAAQAREVLAELARAASTRLL